jgi:hypothetical protein
LFKCLAGRLYIKRLILKKKNFYQNKNKQFFSFRPMEKTYPKSWSVGKWLRKQKKLREKDERAQLVQKPEESLAKYLEHLKSRGIEAPALAIAVFYTRNGLPYTGVVATRKILSNEILIRVPRRELLTTKLAFFSECEQVFRENA